MDFFEDVAAILQNLPANVTKMAKEYLDKEIIDYRNYLLAGDVAYFRVSNLCLRAHQRYKLEHR